MIQKQPWYKLSQLVGARGVKADWAGFPEKLLIPTNVLAETHPCVGKCRGYMDVIRHGDGTYVGVCATSCDKIPLQKKDLIIYTPDFTAIFSGLAQAFNINEIRHAEIDGIPAWQIGEYNPAASYRFTVVAMIEAQPSRIERAIGQLAARFQKPFFLLLPSAAAVTQSIQDIALRNGGKVFAFEDLVEVTADGAIQVRGSAANLLSELVAGWIKHIDGALGETRYPTPAGATWGDIVIEFTADEMVTVSCKGQGHKQYSAEDFQMRNKNTKKPTQAWTFLKQLALTNNQMPVADIDKLKKVKQTVSTNLKKLFALDNDPIEYVSGDNIYRAKFAIRANSSFATKSKRQKTAAA